MKTRYFNTGFVSLQYKNTNQYWSKCSKIYEKITKKNLKIFFEFIIILFIFLFFGLGPAWPVWLGWTQQSYPGHWPNPVTWLPKACMRELFTHAVHSAKVIKITFAQCYITTTDKKKKEELTWCGEAEPKTMTGWFSWIDLRWLYRQCCWRLLTGEWLGRWLAFLLLLLCVFFSSAMFSSVSVFFFCFSRCCCRVCCVGFEGGVDGGCWPKNGLDCGRPFFFFFSVFFFLLLYSPLFLFSSSVSHGVVVVCAAVEVAGRWSCCGRRRWLFSFLCRGVSLFFFPVLSLPLYLVFFSSLRSPSTIFLFHRVLLPLLLLFCSSLCSVLLLAFIARGCVRYGMHMVMAAWDMLPWNSSAISTKTLPCLFISSRFFPFEEDHEQWAQFLMKRRRLLIQNAYFWFGPWMFFVIL